MLREASDHSLAFNLLISLRPRQWAKNLLVFAGLLFGLRLFDLVAVGRAVAAFGIFCLLSGVVYLINDIADRDIDRQHPHKARRPIASGALAGAGGADVRDRAGRRGAGGRVRARAPASSLVAASYLALLALYSGPLKHIVIIDVLTIAIGFVLRAVAGAVAVDVEISHWLLVCTILLALFISLAKRRHELLLLDRRCGQPSADSRRIHAVPARSDDRRRHGLDADRVRVLHDQPGNGAEVRHRSGSG